MPPMPSSWSGASSARPSSATGANGLEDGKGEDWNSFVFFKDPDGNSWAVQESPTIRREMLESAAAAGSA